MAAVDRRNPNLDDFVGLNWSCWADGVNISQSDANVEDSSKYGKKRAETMALRREDMPIYGHCPAHDDFFLVVCGHCGQVVKPQAFEKHCERRHGPLTKMCGQSSSLSTQQRPRPGRPPSNLSSSSSSSSCSSSRERQKDSRCHEAGAPSAALPGHHKRPTKAQKEAVSLPPVEKFPQENPPLPHYSSSSSPRPRVPPWHSGPLPPSVSSSSTLPSDKTQQSDEPKTPLRGTRTYSRVNKNIDKKECDLDKHCGGLDPERKKQCTQQTDSIRQQQRASGRSKTSDELVKEQRTGSAGRDVVRLPVTSKDTKPHLEALEEKPATHGSKLSFASNIHILRSTEPSESFPEEEGDGTVEVEVQPPYPFNQSLLSSEESESEEPEEATDLPATPMHPKPLGLCTFGCRTLGYSIFTFDRRLHRLRFALSAMVEHHISKHLWKKMPQVSAGLRSCHITPAAESPVRKGARPSASSSSRLKSTSSGQLETKSSQHNLRGATSASLVSPRPRNPVGRSGRTRLREPELARDASTAQTAAKLSHSSEDQSFKRIRDPLLRERGQPHSVNIVYPSPSSRGPVKGSLSQGKKPRPPLQPPQRRSPSPSSLAKRSPFPHHAAHPNLRGRGRPPAIQRKVLGCDNRGLAQKRKASGASLSPSLSRTSKFHCLSSPSHSSLLSWKGESVGGALALGREKRSDP